MAVSAKQIPQQIFAVIIFVGNDVFYGFETAAVKDSFQSAA